MDNKTISSVMSFIGSIKTEKKSASSRNNGLKGGRKKKKRFYFHGDKKGKLYYCAFCDLFEEKQIILSHNKDNSDKLSRSNKQMNEYFYFRPDSADITNIFLQGEQNVI